jgi:uncharacterized caspase-like protein
MAQVFPHGYAVVVGVGADLPVTAQDATAVADLLQDPERCAYPADQVHLLTNEQARRAPVLAALDTLAEQTRRDPEATAIVYFSGHGLETPDFHLMPFGYNIASLEDTTISGALFTEKLRAIQSQKLLVLLDCCHAGGQAEAKAPGMAKAPLPPDAMQELQRGGGRVIIASSRKDEQSFSFKDDPYSAFTVALLKGLAGYGAFERDGYARVLDVALYVGRMVPNRTREKQHPIIKVSNLADNFALAYYAAGETQPKGLTWAAHIPALPDDFASAQMATWRRMLANKREALMLIEERMSEYIEQEEVPLQLIKNRNKTEAQIADLEQKLQQPLE